jgi:hypothetical protein
MIQALTADPFTALLFVLIASIMVGISHRFITEVRTQRKNKAASNRQSRDYFKNF